MGGCRGSSGAWSKWKRLSGYPRGGGAGGHVERGEWRGRITEASGVRLLAAYVFVVVPWMRGRWKAEGVYGGDFTAHLRAV